ncbi:MAG: type I-U CRISPR-associated protein Cas5/Cas6 [Planctomyces sp.]|nr:type I-U CRISPR-associated protein Cas5/Cas6 [Planctomyces sp.]
MFALGIRYLTGYSVATDVSNRERAEWPPHPARVFLALAAAHFETGGDPDERAALEWLELQTEAPGVVVGKAFPRDVVVHYVPVNDMETPRNPSALKPEAVSAAMVIIPQYRSKKRPRSFPRVALDRDHSGEPLPVYFVWANSTPESSVRSALDRLCSKVIRIGHSSSFVQLWVEDNPPVTNLEPDELGETRMRVVGPGTLRMLESSYNREAIDDWADLQERIVASKGKAKAALKKELADRFGGRQPQSLRPTISLWQGYRGVAEKQRHESHRGPFDSNLMILSLEEGPVLGLESTWQLATAMHKTLLKQCHPAPEWISGHQPDGSPSKSSHLAIVPLPFVEHEHADGHLLGLALAFPREIASEEIGKAMSGFFYESNGDSKEIELRLNSLGNWRVLREIRSSPPLSLKSEIWTRPSCHWATVTPIVLDHHPKAERSRDRQRWSLEVAEVIAQSCDRQGLPRPIGIDVDKTSWFRGVPRAVAGKGGGFPLMPVKPGQPPRQQVHAWLRFESPVEGPLLLGAGRYRGYGLCRPWNQPKEGRQ